MDHVSQVMASSANIFYHGNICDMTLNVILCLEVKIPRVGNLVQSYLQLIKTIFTFTKILFEFVINGRLQHFVSIFSRSNSPSNPSSLILVPTAKEGFLSLT